jgi:hypothetical protein
MLKKKTPEQVQGGGTPDVVQYWDLPYKNLIIAKLLGVICVTTLCNVVISKQMRQTSKG